MTRALPAALALLAASCAANGAGAGDAVLWQGVIRCGIIVGATTIPLREPITVTVADGQARYERGIYRADTTIQSGYVERGGGPVAPDGRVTLSGSGQGHSFSYTATYQGRLPPGGGEAHLVGFQQWTGAGIPAQRRDCAMDLHR